MIRAEIVREIQALPFPEQCELLEHLARSLRRQTPVAATVPGRLASAAAALRADYQSDPDLTAFTALDSEDFPAAR